MIKEQSYTFPCPACSTKLTIHKKNAGVSGPCPLCHQQVQAPALLSEASEPLPIGKVPSQKNGQFVQPLPRIIAGKDRPLSSATKRTRLDPSGDTHQGRSQRPNSAREGARPLLRVIIPLIFLVLCIGVIFGVKQFFEDTLDQQAARSNSQTLGNSDELSGSREDEANQIDSPVAPVLEGPSIQQTIEENTRKSREALALLEEFLAMETLEQRLPHIETKASPEELENSILATRLPPVLRTDVDFREQYPLEKVDDFFYQIVFGGEGNRPRRQTMLVRVRGDAPPKVVVDPFLDLYGGRFEEFAAKPSKQAGTFQLVVSAMAFCYDDVPDAERKFTLRILPSEGAPEIGKAYFNKVSTIGSMLENPSSGLAFGKAKTCTVLIRWNYEDDPLRPFLEALDVPHVNWNP